MTFEDDLASRLVKQRWFAGKGRTVHDLAVVAQAASTLRSTATACRPMICSTSGSWRMCAARNASRSRAASVPRLHPGFLQRAPQLGQGKLRGVGVGVGGRGRGGKHGAGTGLQNADFTEVAVPGAPGRKQPFAVRA